MLEVPQQIELCIPNNPILQKQVAREIIKRKLADTVEVWPYSVAESFAKIKVINPTSTGQIIDSQTDTVISMDKTLKKEIIHGMKNQQIVPGSVPLYLKTHHAHIQHLLVSPYQFEANEDISTTKNVFYAVKAALKEAQKLGFHRIALPVLDDRHVEQMLDAITFL